MNKRQKLLYSFAKWNYRYRNNNFNDKKKFLHHYQFMKWNYRYVSDEEIKSILECRRDACLNRID